jgi:hypothetical protein
MCRTGTCKDDDEEDKKKGQLTKQAENYKKIVCGRMEMILLELKEYRASERQDRHDHL